MTCGHGSPGWQTIRQGHPHEARDDLLWKLDGGAGLNIRRERQAGLAVYGHTGQTDFLHVYTNMAPTPDAASATKQTLMQAQDQIGALQGVP